MWGWAKAQPHMKKGDDEIKAAQNRFLNAALSALFCRLLIFF
jgi:hypothetical protein